MATKKVDWCVWHEQTALNCLDDWPKGNDTCEFQMMKLIPETR